MAFWSLLTTLFLSLLLYAASVEQFTVLKNEAGEDVDTNDEAKRTSSIITPLQKELAANWMSTLMDDDDASSSSSSSSQQQQQRRQKLRREYPEKRPHVCLAFLSCCNRIDLLNHTLAAAIRHLEDDEPTTTLRYEIAWVDNGSQQDLVQSILETYPIEYALPLRQNMGLAMGMNLLMFHLCTAPYILLLEEDWLYLDDIVAEQTQRRKHAIATSIALLEQGNMVAFDGRRVMGVFLRPETYSSFMRFPYADVWNSTQVNMGQLFANNSSTTANDNEQEVEPVCKNMDESNSCKNNPVAADIQTVDYRIYCADSGFQSGAIWGSYTNGAGLYRRSDLRKIGRMYGEPGDSFHDSYVEGNYAYRAGLQACHAVIRLSDNTTCMDADRDCTAAFYHIGGGRGTRPRKPVANSCGHFAWNFYDTPMYDRFVKYQSLIGQPVPQCTAAELEEHRQVRFKQSQTEQYQSQVQEENKLIFEKERAKRKQVKELAQLVLNTNKDSVRAQVAWMSTMTDAEIDAEARRLIRLADSPHPLDGYWDSHGRPMA